MKIEDLYFGILLPDFNHRDLQPANLFASTRIRWSIARYIEGINDKKHPLGDMMGSDFDPLHFCFGDTQHRTEYEVLTKFWPPSDDDPLVKIDVYTAYVEPNRDYLMNLVNQISLEEAKRYLKEHY